MPDNKPSKFGLEIETNLVKENGCLKDILRFVRYSDCFKHFGISALDIYTQLDLGTYEELKSIVNEINTEVSRTAEQIDKNTEKALRRLNHV